MANTRTYAEELAKRFKIAVDAIRSLPIDEDVLNDVEKILREHFNTAIKAIKEGIKHGN